MKKTRVNDFGIPPPTELIPDNEKIVYEALNGITKKLTPQYVEKNFYKILLQVMKSGYKIFLEHEEKAKMKSLELIEKKYSEKNKDDKNKILFFSGINFENSASQMRKSRAGGAFEIYVEKLLAYIGIPSEKASGKFGKTLKGTDRLVPSVKMAIEQPDRAKFLSMKTTLAERWRQVVQEQNRGWAVYLVTLDENLSADKAEEINKSGIVLFVRDELKSKKDIKNFNNIRKLSDLPEHLSQYKK